MQLIIPLENHLLEMMSWVSNKRALEDWSGPNFSYPFNATSFVEDLKLSRLRSFALVNNKSDFLAFGQYYPRLGKCHLGRLIVNPKFRGKGVASDLMNHLCELGLKELEVKDCSLFVLAHNTSAIKAYQKYGFRLANYPDEMPIANCLYMVKQQPSSKITIDWD